MNTGAWGAGTFSLTNDPSKTAYVANFTVTESIEDEHGGSVDKTYWPKVSGGTIHSRPPIATLTPAIMSDCRTLVR